MANAMCMEGTLRVQAPNSFGFAGNMNVRRKVGVCIER